MRRTRWLPVGAALLFGSVAGCATRTVPAPAPTVVVEAPPPAPVVEEPPPDPIDQLIAESLRYFESGQAELELGHLVRAREEFDPAPRRASRIHLRRADRAPAARPLRSAGRPHRRVR